MITDELHVYISRSSAVSLAFCCDDQHDIHIERETVKEDLNSAFFGWEKMRITRESVSAETGLDFLYVILQWAVTRSPVYVQTKCMALSYKSYGCLSILSECSSAAGACWCWSDYWVLSDSANWFFFPLFCPVIWNYCSRERMPGRSSLSMNGPMTGIWMITFCTDLELNTGWLA